MSCVRALLPLLDVKTKIPSVQEIEFGVEIRIERVLEQEESSTALRA
jgi:hypothetical protein